MTNESYIKKYVFINTEEMTRIYSVFEGNPSEIFFILWRTCSSNCNRSYNRKWILSRKS